MAENTEPVDADNKSPDETAAPPRRAFGSKRQAATPPAAERRPELEEKLADLVDSVKGLQSHLAGGKPIGEAATAPEPKTRGPKRFQRRGGEELPVPEPREPREPILDHEVRGNENTLNKNIAWPRLARLEHAPTSFGERGIAYVQRHPFIIWVLVQATGLGLILLGYWAGSSLSGDEEERPAATEERAATGTGKTPAADLLARVGVNDRAMIAINTALHAEKAGNAEAARQSYETPVTGRARVPGAEYRLAMLDIERNDFASADIHLNNSLTAGEMITNCYFVNGCFAAKRGDFAEVSRQLAHTVKLEPFSGKYLFCYGESLRRAGKSQAAVEVLGQALDRPGAPPDLELIEFKQRLAKVELGQDEAFNKEMADHLAMRPVGGDWLLLAAAQDLLHGAYPAAAGHLGDAAKVLSPHAFSVLIQDYLYQGYTAHPEIAPILKVPPPMPSPKPLDPGAWPFSEADPATWPPFAPAL